MKIRTGFVSNSSSASFVIKKDNLTEEQVKKILDYMKFEDKDGWDITETTNTIRGWTIIDNGDMDEYLEEIGIDWKEIEWEDYR